MKPLTQQAVGTLIELEHTKNRALAAKIARDHIREIPDYYSRLVAMETTAKSNPMPNYHSVRLESPVHFTRFAYRKNLMGKGIDAVFGIYRRGGSRLQAIRFDRHRWTLDKVKRWLVTHPMFRPYSLEPARANPVSAKHAEKYGKKIADLVVGASKSTSDQQKAFKRITVSIQQYHKDLLPLSFLGASSAKVLHSGMAQGWMNAIMYLSPADRAAVAFVKMYPDKVAPLIAAIRRAAQEREEWKAFAAFRPETLDGFSRAIASFPEKPTRDTPLPDSLNRIKPLTMCPWASPVCRAVCLNTAGRGGISGGKKVKALYAQARAAQIPGGDTLADDFKRFFLAGHKIFYGGETNSVVAMRMRRTHAMWLIWATEGNVLKNSFNDLLYEEAKIYLQKARSVRLPLALRFNGTSDLPLSTLQLTNGKYLIDEIGRLGVICYDYTKDYAKYRRWLESGCWQGVKKATSKIVTKHAGFSSNYYLSFSWSEVNGALGLMALRKGGTCVMVFRRSGYTKRKDLQFPKQYKMEKTVGVMPTVIALGQLSDDPADRNWQATVINGDQTDLRFYDPETGRFEFRRENGGAVVGLIAKGGAKKKYDDNIQRRAWRHFTSPVTLRKIGEEVAAEVQINPAGGRVSAALPDTDGDLIEDATSLVGGWTVGTTAMGT